MAAPIYPQGRPGYGDVRPKIITRKNGSTYTVYEGCYKDGKRRYVYDSRKKVCQAKLKDAEREVEQGISTAQSRTATVGMLLDDYLDEQHRRRKAGEITGATYAEYSGVAERHVRPVVGPLRLTDESIWRRHQNLLNDLSGRYKTTAESARKVILGSFNLAVENNILRRSPFADRKLRVRKRRDPITIPTKQDLRALEEVTAGLPRRGEHKLVHAMRRLIFVLPYMCGGMRKGEIAGLQWENVNWISGNVEIRHSYCPHSGLKGPKTKAGRRDVRMIRPVQEALQRLWELRGRPTEGYVIQTAHGKPAYGLIGGAYWASMMKAAGLLDENGKPKFTVHALRHAYVSSLAETGVPLVEISKCVGHSALDMTVGIYAHLFKDAEDRASPAIESVYQSLTRP